MWYKGKGSLKKNSIHRGELRFGSLVRATGPVGCMWVKFTWGYPRHSVSMPPGVTIDGGSSDQGYLRKCRRGSQDYPPYMNIEQIGFAVGMLNSLTISICTSDTAAEGPSRGCSFEKHWYGQTLDGKD